MEDTVWHPKNCLINMKTDTRYFYSFLFSVLGVSMIKHVYFTYHNRNELNLVPYDLICIGGLSGMFASYIFLGYKYFGYGLIAGLFYGSFNYICLYYAVNRKKLKQRN